MEGNLPGIGFLPPRLDALLNALRSVTVRQVLIRGWGSPCAADEHSMVDWITGMYRARYIVIRVCELCEAAEIRDRTTAIIPVVGGRMQSAPDILLGWYSGARRSQRVYS
ncbi:MAG TPA: hypothetical protein VI341_13600 [Actinomycetota bacterium]